MPKDLFTKPKYPKLYYQQNAQDSDWLMASRLKKIVDEGGPEAKEAQKELNRMEETELVYWRELL